MSSLVTLFIHFHPSLSNASSLALYFSSMGLFWGIVSRGLGSVVSSFVSRFVSAQVPCHIPPSSLDLFSPRISISLGQSHPLGDFDVGNILYILCSREVFPTSNG